MSVLTKIIILIMNDKSKRKIEIFLWLENFKGETQVTQVAKGSEGSQGSCICGLRFTFRVHYLTKANFKSVIGFRFRVLGVVFSAWSIIHTLNITEYMQ